MKNKPVNKKSKIKVPPVITDHSTVREHMSAEGLKRNEVNRRECFKGSRQQSLRKTNRGTASEKQAGAGHEKGKR